MRENRRGAPFDADPTDEEEPESLRRARDERFALNNELTEVNNRLRDINAQMAMAARTHRHGGGYMPSTRWNALDARKRSLVSEKIRLEQEIRRVKHAIHEGSQERAESRKFPEAFMRVARRLLSPREFHAILAETEEEMRAR